MNNTSKKEQFKEPEIQIISFESEKEIICTSYTNDYFQTPFVGIPQKSQSV